MLTVIESNLESHLRFLAFVLASYGNDDGKRIFPSLSLLAQAIGLGQNAIRDQRKELLQLKVLQRDGNHAGKYGPIPQFRLNFEALAKLQPRPPSARSEAARQRERRPDVKEARRLRAKNRVRTPYTPVEGVSGSTPYTTVLEPDHGGGETPYTPVVNPLHAGGDIDPIAYVLKNLKVQAEAGTGASAPAVSEQEKPRGGKNQRPLQQMGYAVLADRAVERALQELGLRDLRTVCDFIDNEVAACSLEPISRIDIQAIAHAAIQRYEKPAHRRRSA